MSTKKAQLSPYWISFAYSVETSNNPRYRSIFLLYLRRPPSCFQGQGSSLQTSLDREREETAAVFKFLLPFFSAP